MRQTFSRLFSLLIIFCGAFQLHGDESCCETNQYESCCERSHYRNQVYIGPEIYNARRERDGGTKQDGTIYAVKAGYDHIKRYKIYWGVEGLYGKGTLRGHSGTNEKLRSKFTDEWVEGRIGYTFQQKEGYRFLFTPYVGFGWAEERNNFVLPRILPVHFRLRYTYVPVGFLSQMSVTPYLDVGINFKARVMVEAHNHVSHDPDPDIDPCKMLVKNEVHYRVELPFTYHVCVDHLMFALVPFFEFRHFGGQVNHPTDFQETKLYLAGATLKGIFNF